MTAKYRGRYLFGLIMDIKGKGNNIIKNAIVEKVEPVGVKLTPLVKSKGKKIPKKDKRVIKATAPALVNRT